MRTATSTRSAKASTATCADAPAITTSSRRSSRAPGQWASNRSAIMNAPEGLIGKRVERREDARFLTGRSQYTDDITLHGQTYAAFVRSPYAHAKINSVGTAAAKGAPGVRGVFTGEHFRNIGGLPC